MNQSWVFECDVALRQVDDDDHAREELANVLKAPPKRQRRLSGRVNRWQ